MIIKFTSVTPFAAAAAALATGAAKVVYYAASGGNVTHAFLRYTSIPLEADLSAAPVALATFQAAFTSQGGVSFTDWSPSFEVTE